MARRFADFVHRGIGSPIGYVLGNRAMEQQRLLRHVGDLSAQGLLGAFRDVLPVYENAPLLDIGQTQQQLRERGLARTAHPHEPDPLTSRDVQVEILEHARFHAAVLIGKPDALEVDGALAHHEVASSRLVGHQARLVEHGRHAGSVAECAVEPLQPVVDEVELIRHRVGIGEHEHERARRDTEPCVSARDEHGDDGHDGHRDNRCHDAAREARHHALAIARDDLAIRLVEQPALVVFAPVSLHGEDVRNAVSKLAGKLVLRTGSPLVQVQDAPVHEVAHRSIQREQHHEHDDVDRHTRAQDNADEDDRLEHRQEREVDSLDKLVVGGHELRRLRDERAAEAIGMKADRLVAQAIEAHRGEIVGHGDLELPQRVVLQPAESLPEHVDEQQRRDVGAEHGKDLVGGHRLGGDAVDDEAHDVRVAIAQQHAEADGRCDHRQVKPEVVARHFPVVMQRAPRRLLPSEALRHMPFSPVDYSRLVHRADEHEKLIACDIARALANL